MGRLMAALAANGLAEDTIVVFLADHGDNLGSHHLFNKGRLIEESIRIPMIFHAPDILERDRVNRGQVAQIIDVAPTLLDLAGAEVPDHIQGRSLAPLVVMEEGGRGRENLPESHAFIETTRGDIGIRTRTHLYGMMLGEDRRAVADDCACFFDLNADPYEQRDLAKSGEQGERERERDR